MSREIVIKINEANKAHKYQKEEEFFQIEAFKRVAEILNEHSIGEKTDEITECRFHDTIYIDGDRGAGKTAFMINIEHYYEKFANKDHQRNYTFLNPIDPTLLEHTEKFLTVVLARIIEKINDTKEIFNNISEKNRDNYFKTLDDLSKSLSAIKTLPDDIGIEEIASNKSSLKLEQNAHKFFKEVCTLFDSYAIVILIDDVDMAFDKGFDVLEVLRKYLASPYLIPIVAGDMKLYKEIVETRFKEKTHFFENIKYLKDISDQQLKECNEYIEKINLLDNLVEQYLRKVFHSEYRIELKDIFTILKDNKLTVQFNSDLKVPYSDIKDFEIRHLNFGINQVDLIFPIFSNNTRDLVQYLFSKQEVYKTFFKDIDKNILNSKYSSAYIAKNVAEKFDNKIIQFTQNPLYRVSFQKTAEFYKFSNFKKHKELSELTKNDFEAFENGQYNIYKAFASEYFNKIENFKLDKAKDTSALQSQTLAIKLKEIDQEFNDIHNYIIDLFIFNDYYSSYQTRNYICSGKFLEVMFYSFSKNVIISEIDESLKESIHSYIDRTILLHNSLFSSVDSDFYGLNAELYTVLFDHKKEHIDKEKLHFLLDKFKTIKENISSSDKFITKISEINNLLISIANKIPFGSDFSVKDRYKSENGYVENDEYDLSNKYNLEDFSQSLIIWQNVFLSDVKLNSLAMYRIVYKFFRNLEKIKDLKDKSFSEETPINFFRRIVLIFINSIAFFENSNEYIANTNFAINEKFSLENILSKSQASLKNIQPMFEQRYSLTRALFFHPLISHILFTDEYSKLNDLIFQKDTNSNKSEKQISEKILLELGYKSGIGEAKRIKIMEALIEKHSALSNIEIQDFKNSVSFKNLIGKSYENKKYIDLKVTIKKLFKIQ